MIFLASDLRKLPFGRGPVRMRSRMLEAEVCDLEGEFCDGTIKHNAVDRVMAGGSR